MTFSSLMSIVPRRPDSARFQSSHELPGYWTLIFKIECRSLGLPDALVALLPCPLDGVAA
jgi:hypothetical protein